MGAKQSKRSVDISGKEAESAGEVAAAGAGGEGRMEQLSDADALKPQANGDAHIHDTTEKEKQLDSGTPENEKDATTEKEIKEQEEKEKDTDVPNGESESKVENGESTPSPDDGKKNKKEKVKKKWSLRSISFSRKEKPKQEKKQKDDEVKTNGEPEIVPEEAAETTPDVAEKVVVEETKSEVENKDEKTPETPVTEPLTNGSSTPESPKLEIPKVEEPKNENECDIRPEPKAAVVEPEQLPINGLSLEESKQDEPQVPVVDSNKTEEPKVENTETVPTPESPVKKEVCVDQTHLIEPTPPPLPANPPPSSVASFAATTMAPELSDTTLAKNVDSTETAPVDESSATIENTNTTPTQPQNTEIIKPNVEIETTAPSPLLNDALETQSVDTNTPEQCSNNEATLDSLPSQDDQDVSTNTVEENVCDVHTNVAPLQNGSDLTTETEEITPLEPAETTNDQTSSTPQDISEEIIDSEISKVEQDSGICELKDTDVDASVISQNELNRSLGASNEIECLKAKAKEIIESSIDEPILNGEPVLTNGDNSPPVELELAESGAESPVVSELSMPSLPEAPGPLPVPEEMPEAPEPLPVSEEMPEAPGLLPVPEAPLTPSELCPTESEISVPASPEPLTEAPTAVQEPLPVADKITELMAEIPTVPELNTEMETTTDVAVAN